MHQIVFKLTINWVEDPQERCQLTKLLKHYISSQSSLANISIDIDVPINERIMAATGWPAASSETDIFAQLAAKRHQQQVVSQYTSILQEFDQHLCDPSSAVDKLHTDPNIRKLFIQLKQAYIRVCDGGDIVFSQWTHIHPASY